MMTCIFKLQADHTWKRLKILLSFSTLFACVSVAAKLAGVFHPDVMIIPPTHFQFQYFVQTALKNVWFLETGMEMCIHVFLDLILYFSSTVSWCIGSFWSFEWIQRRIYFPDPVMQQNVQYLCVSVYMIAGSPWWPYGFMMQHADLMHFTTTVNTFHKPEQREKKKTKDRRNI